MSAERPRAESHDTRDPSLPARILIVDDEPLLQRSLTRKLKPLVTEVHVAGSIGEARQLLETHVFDAVVADEQLGLDGGLGSVLLTEISQRFPAMRRVLLSGLPLQHTPMAHVFLHKPFMPAELIAALRGEPAPA